ncbi:MAG: DUF4268 domain-containing protein [Gammaproteobacteria bacterium]|nr:DUF4268 domain-containing protein [Gammaproteobacteria bacterium]MYF66238.1 DUF4268 domain-containing protein [Gammaproteobacteria bacterium]MYK38245.1 DUF4268 domain-containing protein [Gammaproteobacteria bacterium]
MFKVNLSENRLVRLEKRRFNDLNLQERPHLQEWLVQTPEALGEELLVIQKEFDGFADTRERLDLLALDKEGRLVVIENKLDDSGRDVVWQALKYVAYCSSLKKAEIVEIYQKYLDRWLDGQNAVANLCEFLDIEDLDDTVLNAGNEQRLILVAANFRKEVTATVLWLIGHGVQAQCFRVMPYSFGEELLIDLQQIIPTPEAADYMIGMAAKESEEKSVQGTQKRRQEMRRAFWTSTLEELRSRNISRYANISPSKDHWLSSATGVSGCGFSLIFLKSEARVELYLARAEASENKWIFDRLERERQEIEERFGAELKWQRLDDKKASRISHAHPFDGFNDENWPDMIEWLCQHFVKLEDAFSEPLARLNRRLRSQGGISVGSGSDTR